MNGRASRQLRRDVRRTVGEEAIGIIAAQTNAINHQILPNQNALTSRMQDAESQIAGCADAVAGLRQTSATEWRRLIVRVATHRPSTSQRRRRVNGMSRCATKSRYTSMVCWSFTVQ